MGTVSNCVVSRMVRRPWAFCAAVAALLVVSEGVTFSLNKAYAAVPVEESVEDFRRGDEAPVEQDTQRPRSSTAARARSLDIPPTIEPSANSDYDQTTDPVRPIAQSTYGDKPTQPGQPQGQDTAASGGQLSQLFYQLQVLQQEIQDLRGQVEEQTYLVNRLQRDQREQYLDLDKRLVAVTSNQPVPGPSSTPTRQAPVDTGNGSLSERQVYTQAFEAMKARQFDASMVGFQNLIETYPNGQYTPNAYYWLGELYLVAKSDAELARQSFMQVVSLYPDHQKAPDALYKLGVVYHNLNDLPSAKKFLARVQQEHPDSAAAGLARKYAAEL